ncbi:DUF4192 domain-containing protein [Actinokineospora iranica]|uniref:DUF4192 domain-containing protein n=1 Tax=Actinokineospora iranica TaxID=1271860 RepID=A0A1G6LSY5_9PSEU|nr:DUF4192 domain-containing protein [Actinokineospora iranica]SDC46363.1 protein of unknown function [Actinokineospora iranica]
MTTPPTTTVTLEDGGDLIAAIPHLLGFHPADSLVLVTLLGEDSVCLGPIIRADLPAAADAASLAEHLSSVITEHRARSVFVVIVGGDADAPPDLPFPPQRHVVDAVTAAFATKDISVDHALWTPTASESEHWRCYTHPTCSGTVADPGASPIAAFLTVAGLVTYPTREALADTLAPDPEADLNRRSALIDAIVDTELAADAADPAAFIRDLALVESTLAAFHSAPEPAGESPDLTADSGPAHRTHEERVLTDPAATDPDLDDDQLAALAVALSHHDIRDACLAIVLSDRARAADRLWTRLVRAIPAPERAEPACLLAVSAYLRGNGALAGMALDIAADADPGHTLAALLRASMDHAIPPAELRHIITHTARARTRAPG